MAPAEPYLTLAVAVARAPGAEATTGWSGLVPDRPAERAREIQGPRSVRRRSQAQDRPGPSPESRGCRCVPAWHVPSSPERARRAFLTGARPRAETRPGEGGRGRKSVHVPTMAIFRSPASQTLLIQDSSSAARDPPACWWDVAEGVLGQAPPSPVRYSGPKHGPECRAEAVGRAH